MGPAADSSHTLAPPVCTHTHPSFSSQELCKQAMEGTPVCSRWTCPPCIPSVQHKTFQIRSRRWHGLPLRSQLCHLLALQPRASALASLTLGLLIYKEGQFTTPVLSGSRETGHVASSAQARD